MGIREFVRVDITTQSAKVSQQGFGIPLILAYGVPASFTARTQEYTTFSELATDFPEASYPAVYGMASAVFSQNPRPEKVIVGRCVNKPTQAWKVTPTAANSTIYAFEFNGSAISITSDGSGTVAEIITALITPLDALSIGITNTSAGTNTYLSIVANTAGTHFSLNYDPMATRSLLKFEQSHADPGASTDLDAILAENDTWYCVLNSHNSKAHADAISDWCESNEKLFLCSSQDSDLVNLSSGSDSSTIADAERDSTHMWTAIFYHPDSAAFLDGGVAGKMLPKQPGSENWAFKSISGPAVYSLTSTQRTNAHAKYVNTYRTIAGVNVTFPGKVSGNEWIDTVRFRDWLKAKISEKLYSMLVNNDKVPYTNAGLAMVKGNVLAVLNQGVAVGGLAADPKPTVTMPDLANIDDSDKAARLLPDVKFDAVLAGAINEIEIDGNISIS